MEQLLDFSVDLDVGLFDRVSATFYRSAGPEQLMAKQVLERFQEHPDAWKRVDVILERSTLAESKFIALQILEKLIKTMWKALPPVQRQGIKDFIVAIIIKTSSDETSLEKNRTLLGKLNIVLVQILKQDWPHNWPTFIPEIVASSKTNLALCENNMVILKLLSEEIFDFSAEQLTQNKAKKLKNQMAGEFAEIFQLCHEILENATKPSLIKATLDTLLRFLNWIPLGYIFETTIIDILRNRFFQVPEFRNVTLKCFTEIGALQVGPEYDEKFSILFSMVMSGIISFMPVDLDLADIYENSSDDDQNFIQNLALFFSSFFATHLKVVEASVVAVPENRDLILLAHRYLLKVSQVKDREVFKTCLEYWAKLVSELYDEMETARTIEMPTLNISPSTTFNGHANSANLRKNVYADVLSQLRVVMIENMARPEEVLIVENDEGEIVRETLKESDTIMLYKSIREVLVYLTHLDIEDTERIMSAKLERQMDGSEWSWDNLNRLCWAIGSISGAFPEEAEKRFLVMVIKDLLTLTEMKRGKDNKAVVASNIMYVVGQYPRFLKAHWKFLKTVVNKLFEFMHELHEGVQDMACDTFIKISQKCRRHFVIQQPQEVMPFIEELLATIDTITSELQPQQVHTFYEAVGYMISAQINKQQQERLIIKLMESPNRAWDSLMAQAAENVNILASPENIKVLGNILKTNVSSCSSIGPGFVVQMSRIFVDMLNLYKAVSELISQAVVAQGLIATKTPYVRGMRTIKREVLKFVDVFISKAEDLQALNSTMIPQLLETVLGDYARGVEPAKDSEVLNVMANIITRLGALMTDKVPGILDAVFECTLNMINKNFEEYPEHRVAFFKLLQAINQSCFNALLAMPSPQFRLFLDSIVWAFKHTMRDIGDTGLLIVVEMFNNFSKTEPHISNAFFQTYFISLLQDIFFVLTSTSHKSGFKLQAMILMQMFALVDSPAISVPLFDPATVPNPHMTNAEYIRNYVADLLASAFPHLQRVQIQQFVMGLFSLNKDPQAFKGHLRDFLITLKEFAGDDNQELFLDEREAAAEDQKKATYEAALKIPGMIKPHDRPDEGMMD
ncbi:Karyopherin transporter [Polyrhizophydium stewartii]|uniref:Karyopherin transporter n=1 Tax=Polyrhizophydium stewartii TaxID=2732419 RepID=A0ABR4NJ75_9FUNG